MESLDFTFCAEIVRDDADNEQRCGLPAEITDRFELPSTEGPVECIKTMCLGRHALCGTLDSLTAMTPQYGIPEAA